MKTHALVSVIIPTRNRCDLLRETVASVVAQTYENWELIIVDDGSSDRTEEMVLAMASTEPRIQFFRREGSRSGAAVARNKGVSVARGDYIIFLDSDDLLARSCLERRVQIMDQARDADFAAFLTQTFNSVPGDCSYLWNNFSEENDLDRFLRRDSPWHTCGPLWRKTGLAKVGLWDECALSNQDWEFHIRAIAMNLNYLKVPEIDSFWRMVRSNSMSYSWHSTRRVFNRVRLLKKIKDTLHSRNLLTKRRQSILAAQYYEHAFTLSTKWRVSFKIWALARREKVIGKFEFIAVLSTDFLFRISRRANKFVADRVIPEENLKRTLFEALPPDSQVKEFADANAQKRFEPADRFKEDRPPLPLNSFFLPIASGGGDSKNSD